MGRNNTPLLIVAFLFFSVALYMLLSAPSEEAEKAAASHPCPYADVLGLDENSVNPHAPGGSLPPLPGSLKKKQAVKPATPVLIPSADSAAAAAAATPAVPDASTTAAAATSTGAASPPLSREARPVAEEEQAVRAADSSVDGAPSPPIKEEL